MSDLLPEIDTETLVATGRVISVNTGRPRVIEWLDRTAPTSIWKSPVEGRVAARGVNLEGDEQADRNAHGGPDKAVYTYALEDEEWWEAQVGHPIEPGSFGENLTLCGIDVSGAVVGERWTIGTAVFEVSQPRLPCWKLGARFADASMQQRFAAAGRPGAYLRILVEGEIGAGDDVLVTHRPHHGMTVGEMARIRHIERDRAAVLLEVPGLPVSWYDWALKRVKHNTARP